MWAALLLFSVFSIGLGCESPRMATSAAPQPTSTSAPGSGERIRVVRGWLSMGTFFEGELRVEAARRAEAEAWLDWAEQESRRLERVYSRHDPASEVSALNRFLRREAGRRLRISSDLAALLELGQALFRSTGGRFNPAIGALVAAWSEADALRPSGTVLQRALRQSDPASFLVRGSDQVVILRSGAQLDLDAFSKGFVLDRLRADLIQRFPGTPALLSLGQSSVVAIGSPTKAESGWRLGVASRQQTSGFGGTVLLKDEALSVSSSLGHRLEVGGEIYSHVLDPRTGRPVRARAEALVIGPSAAEADAWSTALLVGSLPSDLDPETESALFFRIVYADGRVVERGTGQEGGEWASD